MSMKTACEYSSEGDEKSLLQPQLSTNNSNTVYTHVQNVWQLVIACIKFRHLNKSKFSVY